MATRIYMGGLPYSATEQELENLFGAHGTVTSTSVITDKYTGQAKGFGFVEMSTNDEAVAADFRTERHRYGRAIAYRQRSQAPRRAFQRQRQP